MTEIPVSMKDSRTCSSNYAHLALGAAVPRSDDPIDFAARKVAPQIDARAVPVIVEMAPLQRVGGAIGIEDADALSAVGAKTGIDDSIRSSPAQTSAKRLALRIIVGVERGGELLATIAQIMEPRGDVERDLPELRRPAGAFAGARHEPAMVIDRLEQRHFKRIADVKHAKGAVAETARP